MKENAMNRATTFSSIYYLAFLFSVLSIIGCSKPIDQTSLITRGGLLYAPNEQSPYSGKVFALHSNGIKRLEGEYKNGRADGDWKFWYANGSIEQEGKFREDGAIGKWTYSDTAGKKTCEAEYLGGKKNGSYKTWYANGRPKIERKYRDGHPDGPSMVWNEDGSLVDLSKLISWIKVEGGPGGDFSISATEVTFDQFDTFCDAIGYQNPKGNFGRGKQPVINVNVADAVAFCSWLSTETGTTIRLPEENEWEYAAKGGNKSRGYGYSGSNNIDEVAWYSDNSGRKAHEVGTKKPNELGIYDMSGNVDELCGTSGLIRGGSWGSRGNQCRVSCRLDGYDVRLDLNGFRVLQKR